MQRLFFYISVPILAVIALLFMFWPAFIWAYVFVMPFFVLGLYDLTQKKHTVLRNFPVVGHFRFMLEFIRPEMYQYFIEADWEGRPLNRIQRSVVYQRAKGVLDTSPYGTRKDVYMVGYEFLMHSLKAKWLPKDGGARVRLGEGRCTLPYDASVVNVSAMSFGALSPEAVMAINKGAKEGGFYQNTGEGGLSPYHLKYGGDVVWQLGTACFGARTHDGAFSPDLFKKNASMPNVKMIEIKLSQGAKPGHGGILPAAKLTQEIAGIRNVPMGKDVLSPPTHGEFSTPKGLLEFVERLRKLSGGKPVGFKLCLGMRIDFFSICKAMLETGILPDFITVDGGEGGTGAAPLEFSNAVGVPLLDALPFVHSALTGIGVRDKVRVIASGKLTTGFEILSMLARGADMVNQARAYMLAVGCIMSLKCNNNTCPTGVTTQDKGLRYGLVVNDKYKRVAKYHEETVKSVIELVGAAGLNCHSELRPHHVMQRVSRTQVKRLDEVYDYFEEGALLERKVPDKYLALWDLARADEFFSATQDSING